MTRRAPRGGGRRAPSPRPRASATGERGERAAARWLRWRGFRILDRNVRSRWGEIDLLTRRCGRLAAVEVKTRLATSSVRFGALEERLHPAQWARLRRALEAHPAARRARSLAVDLITVTLEPRGLQRARVRSVVYHPDVSPEP